MSRKERSSVFRSIVILCVIVLSGPLLFSPQGLAQETNPLYGQPTFHLVEKGDFLYKIAQQYNCSYPAVARANGVQNPNGVRAGAKLVIPSWMILPRRNNDETVLINLPEFRLYHFRNATETRVYPLCIGLTTWQTPRGTFEIANKVINPTWYMDNDMSQRLLVKKEIIPPGPLNPLGDRWIGTSLKHIGIHSTNQPMSIGRALSHGCVRLYPEGAKEFFDAVRVKDKGRIIYEPLKVVVWEGSVFLEVHEDVYGLIDDFRRELSERLKNLEIDGDSLDREAVEATLAKRRGIPTVVGKMPNPRVRG